MDREAKTAQSHEDKHTSDCRKAYDVGFAEKCAEFGINPEELVSYMEKAAQSVLPTNPATQQYDLGNYAKMNNPYDNPSYQQPTKPNQDENYGISSGDMWDRYGWGLVGGTKSVAKTMFNPGNAQNMDEWFGQLGEGASMLANSAGSVLGATNPIYTLGRGIVKSIGDTMSGNQVEWGKNFNPFSDRNWGMTNKEDPQPTIPEEKKTMTYEKWQSYSPQQQSRLAEGGVSYDPQSQVDYNQKQKDKFMQGLAASGYKQ